MKYEPGESGKEGFKLGGNLPPRKQPIMPVHLEIQIPSYNSLCRWCILLPHYLPKATVFLEEYMPSVLYMPSNQINLLSNHTPYTPLPHRRHPSTLYLGIKF